MASVLEFQHQSFQWVFNWAYGLIKELSLLNWAYSLIKELSLLNWAYSLIKELSLLNWAYSLVKGAQHNVRGAHTEV